MQSCDAVLEAIPRRFEIDEYRLVFGWDPSVAMAASRLYNSALAIFLRVAVYNKKIDSSMPQKLYLEAVRDRGVMPARRLASALSFFAWHGQLMVEIARRRGLIDPSFSNDSAKICFELSGTISTMEKDGTRLVQEFYAREGVVKLRVAKLVDDWFCTVMALCRDINAIVDVLSQAGLLKDASRYASGIPALVQCVDRLFTTEFIMDVAMTLSDYPLRRLLRLRTQVLQSGIDFYHTVLVRMSRDQKVATILSVLELERLTIRAQKGAVGNSSCRSTKILENRGLGDVNRLSDSARQALEEISQILPHLSVQYIHLCLRHFGYDASKAIDALLARDESLPLALRRVEAADLTPRSTAPPTLPAFSFQNDELVLSALPRPRRDATLSSNSLAQGMKEPEGKNVFKGLISLAPIVPAQPNAAIKPETAEKPVSEVMKKLKDALEALKLRAAGVEDTFEPQFGVNGERLVPMPTAKKYAGIKKFKVSEADKVAIRPSYEKYRYETPDDDNVYDDEYDDGYEQREFKVEPLNAQSSSEESGTEESEGSDAVSSKAPQSKSTRGRGASARCAGSSPARGGSSGNNVKSGTEEQTSASSGNVTSRSNYTGGRQRQMKERHKNAYKQRGADRKMRGAY
ncbi:hypothetical protein ANCCAN_19576 [Ancylostoma caninum]|uniref:CUE domain-containing protein n=1 Tax=Ancylostoma caninum TaxID=29170 RepID=A0A368FUS5_ANCCA|nr:hypothetical protein ANCCAN_19576 [Ancylostoma caninum]